ncbi:MAG TPA: DUF1360 domain-containing protein [Mycobacteriales bacterium]|nr:DUF1360 domain-containing protein [Mycobacteriales bacterium]
MTEPEASVASRNGSPSSQQEHPVAAHYGRPASELRGYAAVMAVYATAVSIAAAVMKRTGRLPGGFRAGDLALMTLATHKLSRTISRDSVTSPLRAPFARFEGAAGPGEVNEKVAARGAGKAVGELLTCPFCLDQWVATGLVTGLAVAPRLTRYVAAIFAVRAGADLVQFGYAAAEHATSAE